MSDNDFNLEAGKLGGKWVFNDLLGHARPDHSKNGQYMSPSSGSQKDAGFIRSDVWASCDRYVDDNETK